MVASSGFWILNRVANPVLRRVLRAPPGRRLGRSLAVLRYTGTRTGKPHELVCQYVRQGGTVWVLVGQADRKTWWHSLRTPAQIDLWLAGERHSARARAVEGARQPAVCAEGLATYLAGLPRAASTLGLPPDGTDRAAALTAAARRTVMVRADLAAAPAEEGARP
jgi:hypothetical protein